MRKINCEKHWNSCELFIILITKNKMTFFFSVKEKIWIQSLHFWNERYLAVNSSVRCNEEIFPKWKKTLFTFNFFSYPLKKKISLKNENRKKGDRNKGIREASAAQQISESGKEKSFFNTFSFRFFFVMFFVYVFNFLCFDCKDIESNAPQGEMQLLLITKTLSNIFFFFWVIHSIILI